MSETHVPNREDVAALPEVNVMLDQLRTRNEVGALFADMYDFAIRAEPKLQGAIIHGMGSATNERLRHTGGHAIHKDETESGRYEIIVNVDDGLQFYSDLKERRPKSVQICADLLGIPENELDARKFAAFIFLHELGHVYDFQENAPTLEEKRVRREAEGQKLIVKQMSPGKLADYLATDQGVQWFAKHKENFHNAYGIETPGDLLATQEVWYRQLDTEKMPDQFAVRMMKSAGLV